MATEPPTRKGRDSRAGSLFPSQILAQNVRALRRLFDLKQDDLAERMISLGHSWYGQTVSEVERRGRTVTIDELVALAMALGTSLNGLLSPSNFVGRDDALLVDVGLPDTGLSNDELSLLVVGVKVQRQPPFQRSTSIVSWRENQAIRFETVEFPIADLESETNSRRGEEED